MGIQKVESSPTLSLVGAHETQKIGKCHKVALLIELAFVGLAHLFTPNSCLDLSSRITEIWTELGWDEGVDTHGVSRMKDMGESSSSEMSRLQDQRGQIRKGSDENPIYAQIDRLERSHGERAIFLRGLLRPSCQHAYLETYIFPAIQRGIQEGKDRVVFPATCRSQSGNHVIFMAINLRNRRIECYDPKGGQGNQRILALNMTIKEFSRRLSSGYSQYSRHHHPLSELDRLLGREAHVEEIRSLLQRIQRSGMPLKGELYFQMRELMYRLEGQSGLSEMRENLLKMKEDLLLQKRELSEQEEGFIEKRSKLDAQIGFIDYELGRAINASLEGIKNLQEKIGKGIDETLGKRIQFLKKVKESLVSDTPPFIQTRKLLKQDREAAREVFGHLGFGGDPKQVQKVRQALDTFISSLEKRQQKQCVLQRLNQLVKAMPFLEKVERQQLVDGMCLDLQSQGYNRSFGRSLRRVQRDLEEVFSGLKQDNPNLREVIVQAASSTGQGAYEQQVKQKLRHNLQEMITQTAFFPLEVEIPLDYNKSAQEGVLSNENYVVTFMEQLFSQPANTRGFQAATMIQEGEIQ